MFLYLEISFQFITFDKILDLTKKDVNYEKLDERSCYCGTWTISVGYLY